MKNKKGFTLIELLAVIVILAIIALIATPVVLNMIKNAKKSAAKSSGLGFIDSIEKYSEFSIAKKGGLTLNGYDVTLPISSDDESITCVSSDYNWSTCSDFMSAVASKTKGAEPKSALIKISKYGKVLKDSWVIYNGYKYIYNGTDFIEDGDDADSSNQTSSQTIKVSGTLVDLSGNSINNKLLVMFSDTPHYAQTSSDGYFFIDGIEEGNHELYLFIDKDLSVVSKLSKEEIIAQASASTTFNTSDSVIQFKNYNINSLVMNKKNKILKNQSWVFEYKNSEYIYSIPYTGVYKLETWGAQGGSYNSTYHGGYGGYSVGYYNGTENENLYIYVGGRGTGNGSHANRNGGFNGGGNAKSDSDGNTRQASGGGATHIATVSGKLNELGSYKGEYDEIAKTYISNDILIVSGGGGGAGINSAVISDTKTVGGSGGGFKGTDGLGNSYGIGYGGQQKQGGSYKANKSINNGYMSKGTFGQGGNAVYSGAGGGFFGGGVYLSSSGGGSSYIGSSKLVSYNDETKAMYCYGCSESNDLEIKTINTTGTNSSLDKTNCSNGYSSNPIGKCAKTGDGYVKISIVE